MTGLDNKLDESCIANRRLLSPIHIDKVRSMEDEGEGSGTRMQRENGEKGRGEYKFPWTRHSTRSYQRRSFQKHRPPLALICNLHSFEVKLATRIMYMRFQKASSGPGAQRQQVSFDMVHVPLLGPAETPSTHGIEDIQSNTQAPASSIWGSSIQARKIHSQNLLNLSYTANIHLAIPRDSRAARSFSCQL
jgi:hypothetical protein